MKPWALVWSVCALAGAWGLEQGRYESLIVALAGGAGLWFLGGGAEERGREAQEEPPLERKKGQGGPSLARGATLLVILGLALVYCVRKDPIQPRTWIYFWLLALAAGLVLFLTARRYEYKVGKLDLKKAKPSKGEYLFWLGAAMVIMGFRSHHLISVAGLLLMILKAGPWEEAESRPRTGQRLAAMAILLAGLGLHLHDLREIPQGMNIEEYQTLALAFPVRDGKEAPFDWSTPGFGGVTLYHHLVGWFYRFFNTGDVLPLRLTSVLGWLILALYSVFSAERLFGSLAAAGAAAYLSFSFFPLFYGRFGFYFIWGTACGAGALAHTLWGLRSRKPGLHFAAAGFWAGAASYFWLAGWLLPLAAPAYLLGSLGKDRKRWNALRPALAPGLLAAFVTAAPALWGYWRLPGGFMGMFGGTRYPDSSFVFSGSPFLGPGSLGANLVMYLREMLVTGNIRPMHYLPKQPLLNPMVLAFMATGLARLFVRPWSGRSLAMATALLAGFLPAWLSMPVEGVGANFTRLTSLLFPFSLLFGAGLSTFKEHQSRPSPRRKWRLPSWPGLLLFVACSLGMEPFNYFYSYRDDLSAVKDNFGPETELGRRASALLKPETDLFLSEQYRKTGPLGFALSHKFEYRPLREAPDWILAQVSSGQGAFLTGAVWSDWKPWLERLDPKSRLEEIQSPWPELFENRVQDPLADSGLLGLLWTWKLGLNLPGPRLQAPGIWEALLWPPASHRYRVLVRGGSLSFEDESRIEADRETELELDALPYRVILRSGTGALPEFRIKFSTPDGWADLPLPLINGLERQGLRKTLRTIGAPERVWVSLSPVISQRFHEWSYEAHESRVGFPCAGLWEGRVHVPGPGRYRFSVPNTFGGLTGLKLGGSLVYQSREGKAILGVAIQADTVRDWPLVLNAEKIMPDAALRFLVSVDDGQEQPVPSAWLSPAPLPRGPVRAGNGGLT